MTLPSPDLSSDPLLSPLPRDSHARPLLGGVALLRKLGTGGMGSVYLGRQLHMRRHVAVKILPWHLTERDPTLLRRFVAEARLAAALEDEHVVRVFDAGSEGRTYYTVMEYVPGESAGAYLKRLQGGGARALPEGEAFQVALAAARGLAAAHGRGIVHRDIKPDNILIPNGDFEGAKLADLGLAKPEAGGNEFLTASFIPMGTPGFMAPEQAENAKAAGPAADVFAFGATLYALLCGRAPFGGASLVSVLKATIETEPPALPDAVSAGLRAVVARCLRKMPAERFANGAELLEALERVDRNPDTHFAMPEGLPANAAPSAPATTPFPGSLGAPTAVTLVDAVRTRRSLSVVAAVLLAVTAFAGGIGYLAGSRRPAARDESSAAKDVSGEVDDLRRRAKSLASAKKWDEAAEALDRAFELAPGAPGLAEERRAAQAARIEALVEARDAAEFERRRGELERAREAAARDRTPAAWEALAEACDRALALARGEETRDALRALRAESERRRLWAEGRAAEAAGDAERAIDLLRRAAGGDEAIPGLDADLARLEAAREDKERRAKRRAEFAAALQEAERESDPGAALPLWQRARDLADGDDARAAAEAKIRDLTARLVAEDRDRRAEAALRSARAALAAGRWDEAEREFRTALDLRPGAAEAEQGLKRAAAGRREASVAKAMAAADAAEKKGKPAEAAAALEKGLAAVPKDPELTLRLEDVRWRMRRIAPQKRGSLVEVTLPAGKPLKIEFRSLKPGTFAMGDGAEVRKVTLTAPFAMQTTEFTQDQLEALEAPNIAKTRGARLPVDNACWWDAVIVSYLLNDRLDGWAAALPTEAQWEYACRAGSEGKWCFGDEKSRLDDYAWTLANSGDRPHEVGTLRANDWGLYDMHGNVWEWCQDWFAAPDRGSLTDPIGPADGVLRVLKGGGHGLDLGEARCAARLFGAPTDRAQQIGFRLILVEGRGTPHVKRERVGLDGAGKVKLELVRIRACTAICGQTFGRPGETVREVTLTKDFWIAATETTQAQWEALMGPRAWGRAGAELPAAGVTWEEAGEFARRLGEKLKAKGGLPTEAEWEVAAKAQVPTHYPLGDSDDLVAHAAWTSRRVSAAMPVARLWPNLWGLYDVAGNVAEWCADWYGDYPPGRSDDPAGPGQGSERVVRGGSFATDPADCRCAARAKALPTSRRDDLGFRVVVRGWK